MNLLYNFTVTKNIEALLLRIEVAKKVIDLLPQLPKIESNLRRQTLLKSSLFSAKIEGNTLELNDLNERSAKNKEKREILNILKALEWIHSANSPQLIGKQTLTALHQKVMAGFPGEIGSFRKEMTAIFNQADIAIYMPPPPEHLPYLLDQLIEYVAKSSDHPSIIAAKAHFMFEKIHPFVDGNGRVGRLLSTLILKQKNYDLHGLVSIEEYLNNHRTLYYDLLSNTTSDITSFIEFFLAAFASSAEASFNKIKDVKEEKAEDSILPRPREILHIIREQKTCSFDMIKRRFGRVAASTLHYDLQMLLKKGLVKKLGATRGVMYVASEK